MKFLLNTFTHWEEPPRARHQVALALALKYEVDFVAANKVGLPRIIRYQVKDNLWIVQPSFPISNKIRYRIPVVNEIYQSWLFRKLKKKYIDCRVVNFDFTAVRIYKYFKDVIFYYNDNFAAVSRRLNPAPVARYHEKVESKVAAKAKFCISVTEILKDKLASFNPNSFEIPLGGPDISEFNIEANTTVSNQLPIKVGLVGFISDYNISAAILNYILQQDQLRLIIVGPVDETFIAKLENKERMILKGSMTGEKLFREINTFDVTITPYCEAFCKDEKVAVGTGSKMYQYLALGKPVVVTNMVGLKKVTLPDKFLYIAQKEHEFPALIEKAHHENTGDAIRERVRFAVNNTWEKRMESLIEIYNQF